MMHFGKWLLVVMLIDLLLQRIDVLVLTRLVSYEELGLYSVAVRIAMFASILAGSSTAIFMPRGCESMKSAKHLKVYFKESLLIVSGLALFIVALIIFCPILIKLFFGLEYEKSVLASRFLLLDAIFVLLYTPLGFLFYANGNSKIISLFSFIKLTITITSLLICVPRFGSTGAALSLALSSFACFLLVLGRCFRIIRYPEENFPNIECISPEGEKCLVP
jgi:O-antigen/teichoic acid export membrane protein